MGSIPKWLFSGFLLVAGKEGSTRKKLALAGHVLPTIYVASVSMWNKRSL